MQRLFSFHSFAPAVDRSCQCSACLVWRFPLVSPYPTPSLPFTAAEVIRMSVDAFVEKLAWHVGSGVAERNMILVGHNTLAASPVVVLTPPPPSSPPLLALPSFTGIVHRHPRFGSVSSLPSSAISLPFPPSARPHAGRAHRGRSYTLALDRAHSVPPTRDRINCSSLARIIFSECAALLPTMPRT